tara:strand:+ start:618 stop:719 length:102 start_codon:yes stop_codon:yes gene_type:complete
VVVEEEAGVVVEVVLEVIENPLVHLQVVILLLL